MKRRKNEQQSAIRLASGNGEIASHTNIEMMNMVIVIVSVTNNFNNNHLFTEFIQAIKCTFICVDEVIY
jgi:hypothetical protein